MSQKFPIELYDIYAESAAIGCILISEKYALEILSKCSYEDFSGERWRIIKCAFELKEKDEEISFLSIKDKLLEHDWLDKIGDVKALNNYGKLIIDNEGLIKIHDSNAIFSSIEILIAKIREKSNARKLLNQLERISEDLKLLNISVADACVGLREAAIIDYSVHEKSFQAAIDIYPSMLDHINKLRVGEGLAVSTKIEGFDKSTGGLRPGDLLLISGLPKGCKSALALTLADNLSQGKIACGFHSLEMRIPEIECRRICFRLNSTNWSFTEFEGKKINLDRIMGGFGIKISDQEAEMLRITADTIAKDPIYFTSPNIRNVKDLLLESEKLILSHNVKVIIIDYAQLVTGNGSDYQNLTLLAQEYKNLANTRGVSIVLLSQLNMEGAQMAKALNQISSDYVHGSGELVKSATIITNCWLQKTQLSCLCVKQNETERTIIGKQSVEIIKPKHEFKSTIERSLCKDCKSPIIENPIRQGGWFIERARASAGNRVIPFEFEGRYMTFNWIE